MISTPKRRLYQTLILSFLSALILSKALLGGLPNAPRSYSEGVRHFLALETPYQAPTDADWFKYSPAFALFYSPLTFLHPQVHSLLWGLLNIVIFWAGISFWFLLCRDQSKWWWAAFVFCSMELDGPVRHLQVNALLIGMMMIGFACFRDKKYAVAGVVFALAANFKVLPMFFVILLFLQFRTRFIWSFLIASVVLLLVPALKVGWALNMEFHLDWLRLLLSDGSSAGILDIETVLKAYGVSTGASFIRYLFLAVSVLYMGRMARARTIDWPSWISLGLAVILIFSPRTESPTFVLIAPAYLLLLVPILKGDETNLRGLAVWLFGVFLVTLSFNDIWPKFIWNPRDNGSLTKTLGVVVLWGLAFYQGVQAQSSKAVLGRGTS